MWVHGGEAHNCSRVIRTSSVDIGFLGVRRSGARLGQPLHQDYIVLFLRIGRFHLETDGFGNEVAQLGQTLGLFVKE